mmetsp:Transcript_26817/g.52317  ORF Transcript_26817/g.52317 Transcript_26817/m.52317 type:complete len:215 (+) Transcript_26817:2-646(+)
MAESALGDTMGDTRKRRYAVAVAFVGALLLVVKLSGRSVAAAGMTRASHEDYLSLAQREMMVGGEPDASVQARAELLARLTSLKEATTASSTSAVGGVDAASGTRQPAAVAATPKAQAVAAAPSALVKAAGGKQTLADTGAGGGSGNDTDMGVPKPGWDKSGWTKSDWSFWVLTGPVVTLSLSFFMFYTYGMPGGVLTLLVAAVIDTATFYYNL